MNLTINGRRTEVEVQAEESLLSVIRNKMGLLGTKESCKQGECGCCTVILNGKTVNACITPARKAEGGTLLTIEGLAQKELHVLQQAFMEAGAVQCGYCTPGMILSAKAFLDENAAPTREKAAEAVSGNICRCTGYTKIIEAILLAADKMAGNQNG